MEKIMRKNLATGEIVESAIVNANNPKIVALREIMTKIFKLWRGINVWIYDTPDSRVRVFFDGLRRAVMQDELIVVAMPVMVHKIENGKCRLYSHVEQTALLGNYFHCIYFNLAIMVPPEGRKKDNRFPGITVAHPG